MYILYSIIISLVPYTVMETESAISLKRTVLNLKAKAETSFDHKGLRRDL